MAIVEFKDAPRIYTSGDHMHTAFDGASIPHDAGK